MRRRRRKRKRGRRRRRLKDDLGWEREERKVEYEGWKEKENTYIGD